MFDAFGLPYFQDGLVQIALLAIAGGLLGTWIVLRGLAFYSHAVAAASFPGLVLAGGLGFAGPLGAFAAGGLFAATVGRLSARDPRAGYDATTALVLVAALAGGVVLASDVFHSGAQIDTLLFGSLLLIDGADQALAAVAALLAVATTLTLGPRWLASGFDRDAAHSLGIRTDRTDLVLLGIVALTAVAALAAAGALLAGALLVIPAATTRLWTQRLVAWQLASVALAGAEGVAGLWLSVELNAPPGATIAVLAGAVFAAAPLIRVRALAAPALAAAALIVAGCGSGAAAGKPVVVATTTQIGDFARTVGGDAISVHQILAPNTDPHDYEPRPDDIGATADAKLVLTSGHGLDSWIGKVIDQSGSDAPSVALGDVAQGVNDPHWWHDPRNVVAAVARMRAALDRVGPGAARAIDRRARAYASSVKRLDSAIAACMASVPASQRKLVTTHDAFAWFARRYHIRVVGAVIGSTAAEAQPSAGDVALLARQVKRERVHAVFLETSRNNKLGEALARQTGTIGNLELYGDTLGPSGSRGATYLGMERANADAMMRGFTGGKRGCP